MSLGAGGCSSNCYCDRDTDGYGRCTQIGGSTNPCSTDAGCPSNEFCDAFFPGSTICLNSDGCTSTYTAPSHKKRNGLIGIRGKNGRKISGGSKGAEKAVGELRKKLMERLQQIKEDDLK